jgi:hypothetical protein
MRMILFLALLAGCQSPPPATVEQPIQVSDSKPPVPKREYTDAELEAMAAHEPQEGVGMGFYYAEKARRIDAAWAKEELRRRKAE